MAIDGVKIIDSDDAYDIYNDIVERYKDGEEIEKIKQEWIDEEKNFCTDELHTEIYWAALAYSLWKIGCLDERIKTQTLDIIKEGASRIWDEIDVRARKQRQKVLDKLIVQISSENPKPLKKPKPQKPQKPYFTLGDVLAIEMPEGYGLCFVSRVDQSPRKIEYHLACTRLLQKEFPTMDDFINSEIACGKNNRELALKTDCWFNHKALGLLCPFLKKIGKIKTSPYGLWTLSPASKLKDFYDEINRDIEIWGLSLLETYYLIEDILEE